jgi:glyoxylase-like metal-dependent hydrolase (beta-lactamase superfamily II)
MTRRFNRFLLILLVLVGLPYYWLLVENRPGDAAPKPVTIEQLRALASSIPGPAPTEVRMELVGWRHLPGALFAAGTGIKRRQIGIMAWQLTVPGGKPVIIDTGATSEFGKQLDVFHPGVQRRVERAMDGAGLILATHEHPDHLGPLAKRGGKPLRQIARLNPGQLPSAPVAGQLVWRERDGLAARIAPGAPQTVAAGVVVIPAPSHTPGSQMIYARLGDGREYLFAGDIATLVVNWEELRARSRLLGDWLAPEQRSEVYAWLRTIQALKAAAPNLVVVPGHDVARIYNARQKHGIVKDFVLP